MLRFGHKCNINEYSLVFLEGFGLHHGHALCTKSDTKTVPNLEGHLPFGFARRVLPILHNKI
jgi:hypothetical protein